MTIPEASRLLRLFSCRVVPALEVLVGFALRFRPIAAAGMGCAEMAEIVLAIF
jgi:hypothetical protein